MYPYEIPAARGQPLRRYDFAACRHDGCPAAGAVHDAGDLGIRRLVAFVREAREPRGARSLAHDHGTVAVRVQTHVDDHIRAVGRGDERQVRVEIRPRQRDRSAHASSRARTMPSGVDWWPWPSGLSLRIATSRFSPALSSVEPRMLPPRSLMSTTATSALAAEERLQVRARPRADARARARRPCCTAGSCRWSGRRSRGPCRRRCGRSRPCGRTAS